MMALTGAAFAAAMALAAGGGDLAGKDKSFADKAAMSGMKEVEASKAALQHASGADVKQFAQTMVDDHTKANEKLKDLAQSNGWTLPGDMDASMRKDVDALAMKQGTDFDKAYIAAMVKDHDMAVKLFGGEAQGGSNPQLKDFAKTTLPTLQHHQSMAKELKAGK